jgi:hypothetical protein
MGSPLRSGFRSSPNPEPQMNVDRPFQTAADIILSHMSKVPPEIMAAMPTDGASRHDHYIYGWPKREV